MKKILFLLLSCISIYGFAQALELPQLSNVLPQVFSPDAAELGKYGRIPVNYFNGLPNITIPLTEVHAKNYTLPVYLSYHASGNKPDHHPGWVGQGWSLHAGGCINRIINGMKDETLELETSTPGTLGLLFDPGYLYHASSIQEKDWNNKTVIDQYRRGFDYDRDLGADDANNYYCDYEPDEFQINIDDIHASFYFIGDGKIKIVSKSGDNFSVSYTMNRELSGVPIKDFQYEGNNIILYNTFYEFIVTKDDGTKYYFGGQEDAIEYSMIAYGVISGLLDLKATANTWMLTKIEMPDGEEIYFNYRRDGVPIVVIDYEHYGYAIANNIVGSHLDKPGSTFGESVDFEFLLPSFLESVRCKYGRDSLVFNTSKSIQKKYDYTNDEFRKRIGDITSKIKKMDYYPQLDEINTGREGIHFNYTSDPETRLKLNSVSVISNHGEEQRYEMNYDGTPLPEYNSRKTDPWGYYNSAQKYSIYPLGTLYQRRNIVNKKLLQAEMLTKIKYPTGGWTEFEYEPNDYGRIATQYPFSVIDSTGQAGGLRISTIKDYSSEGHFEERVFSYETSDGISSGILSGIPIYYVSEKQSIARKLGHCFSFEDIISHLAHWDEFDNYTGYHYVEFSETPINQLSDTDGNHVTYTMVTETIPGVGKTIYNYSNHDTKGMQCMDQMPTILHESFDERVINNPFTSLTLSRGLLLKKSSFDIDGNPVMEERYSYAQDLTQCLYSMSQYIHFFNLGSSRRSLSKIYTYYPALTSKTVTEYPTEPNGSPHVVTTTYTYNSNRKLTSIEETSGTERYGQHFYYPSDRGGMTYEGMISQGMSGIPVGIAKTYNGKVVDAQELTYGKVSVDRGGTFDDISFMPLELYSLKTDASVTEVSYGNFPFSYLDPKPDVEYIKYNGHGDLLGKRTADGGYTAYGWNESGNNPSFIAPNVRTPIAKEKDIPNTETYTLRFTDQLIDEFEFDTIESSTVEFYIGNRQHYNLYYGITIDGIQTGVVSFGFMENPMPQSWIQIGSQYTQSARVTIPGGHHKVRILKFDGRKEGNVPDYPAGNLTVRYNKTTVVTSGVEDIVKYIDFESTGGNAEGFHSDHGHKGSYTISQTVPSDRKYVLDYMKKGTGKWSYYRQSFTGSATIGSASTIIDNVRIYPEDADMKSYTWDDNNNLLSMTDASGRTVSYEYDGMDRLVSVSDLNGNKMSSYEYLLASMDGAGTLSRRDSNYVKTISYNNAAGSSYNTTLKWYDGLGRESGSQMLSYYGSLDVSTDIEYDALGREWKRYLPVPDDQRGEGVTTVYGETRPYEETVYEASPLGRVSRSYGAGAAWRTADKYTGYTYTTNGSGAGLSCYRFELTYSGSSSLDGQIRNMGLWSAGSLTVVKVRDEDGREAYEFKDIAGNTVLNRKVDENGYLDTYMIYDVKGRLVAVLPPMLSPTVAGATTTALSSQSVRNYGYLYRYDGRNRCIAKKLPGAGWTYMVYDAGDRLVFSQDAEQRKDGRWSFTLADILGRDCVSGICYNVIDVFGSPYDSKNIVVEKSYGETGSLMGYSVTGVSLTNPTVLSANYYDDYDFITSPSVPSAVRTKLQYAVGPSGYSGTKWNNAAGSLTGSASRILGEDPTNDYIWSSVYYNGKGNAIQSRSTRQDGGVDINNTVYTFTGKPSKVRVDHNRGTGGAIVEEYQYTYDKWDRSKVVKHRINESETWTTVSDILYDKVGRLSSDRRNGVAALKRTLTYNPRSWVKKLTGPGFTETLYYETSRSGNTPQWGGNISTVTWTGQDASVTNTDNYVYDPLSRLKSAISKAGSTVNYSETYSYDKHGNILSYSHTGLDGNETMSMTHDGNRLTGVNSSVSGNSTVTYDEIGRMKSSGADNVSETRYNAIGFPAYISLREGGYVQNTYTAGGARLSSRRTDGNNVVTVMSYEGNEIYENGNLRMLLFTGGYVDYSTGTPEYLWYTVDHLGSVRAVADASGNVVASYAYRPYGQEFAANREGTAGAPKATIASGNPAQQRPGLVAPTVNYTVAEGPDWQPFRFGGKENLERVGLDLYDFGARMYSPSNMRWMTMDPLAEKYYHISPYVYCNSNPVNLVDPDGKQWYLCTDKDGNLKYVYCEGEMSIKEMQEYKNIEYVGLTHTDEKSNTYYSLFGNEVPIKDENGSELNSKLYKHVDRLIISAYGGDEPNGIGSENFYIGVKPGTRIPFEYNGADFKSKSGDGDYFSFDNDRNSQGKIHELLNFKRGERSIGSRSGLKGFGPGYFLWRKSKYSDSDIMIITYNEENAKKFSKARDNVFKKR